MTALDPRPSTLVSGIKRIALCGLAGSGKSTAAKHLVERHGFHRISYASPIKRMVRTLLIEAGAGFMEAVELVDGVHKEDPTQFLCGRTARQAMQTLGVEWGWDFIGPDIWRKILLGKVQRNALHPLVVDDCRFPCEADDLRREGFLIVRVVRPSTLDSRPSASAHSSEVQHFDVDITLDNAHGLSHLHSRLDELLLP